MRRHLVTVAMLLAFIAPTAGAAAVTRATGPPGGAAATTTGMPAAYRPAAVAPVAGAVQRPFEQPDGPYGRGHRGVDLRVRPSEQVRAALPGTVRFAGRVVGETWVTVTHADGLETTYGGVAATVAVGQRVALGQPIGRMRHGRRHLDWGARLRGGYIDPLGLLTGWRVRLVPPRDR
jgi:murein DD-endopeptidase MepM/ murein hydrolase activator NlpD